MYNLSLIQANLVQGTCVNMLPPGDNFELNIELNHTINTTAPGLMDSITKLTVSPKKIDLASPFNISFELRASYKAPLSLSSDDAFDESIHIVTLCHFYKTHKKKQKQKKKTPPAFLRQPEDGQRSHIRRKWTPTSHRHCTIFPRN